MHAVRLFAAALLGLVLALPIAARDAGAKDAHCTAAEALVARCDQARDQIDALLAVLRDPARLPGAQRTSSILLVLSKLIRGASLKHKEAVLVQAVKNLPTSPDGALAVMEALGPQAVRAVPSIREYRATADRIRRAHINRHVLPAILPNQPVGP